MKKKMFFVIAGGSIQIRALCMEPSSNALDYS